VNPALDVEQPIKAPDTTGGVISEKPSKVLVVEDDRPTRMLLERIIRARGHEVIGCASAEAALETLQREFIPLITLDIQLPGMSGLELAKRLRADVNGGFFYILVGTGNNRMEDLREILEAGADDYIAKPYHPGLLDIRLSVAESAIRGLARRKALEEELKFLARHDPLTKLFNRSNLLPALESAIGLAVKGQPGVLLYLDLDNFKIINDTLGHETGDELLVGIAEKLRAISRKTDTLVRFGGDEFVIIMPNCPLNTAIERAEELRESVEEIAYIAKGNTLRVGTSIGLAVIDGSRSASDTMSAADEACYAAKARGRNRVEVHSEEDGAIARLIADTDWSNRIKSATRDGSLQLWYQPVIAVETGQIFCQEILLRYEDANTGTLIAPGAFLPALHRSGQMTRLDRFVITSAFEALAEKKTLTVAINISGDLFGDNAYCEFIESMLGNSGIAPSRIIFEITENELIPNLQHASGSIIKLQEIGCRFAMDDFGSGFSSLNYLKNLPIDFLKIDGTFTRDLPNQDFNQAILRATKEITKVIGLDVVAESVETKEEFELVKSFGITYAQGYYIGRPRRHPFTQEEVAANLAL